MEDRSENMRRVAEMIGLFIDGGVISLTAFISPLEVDRVMVKELIGPENILEIYCNCSLEICESRDVKGLYKKARKWKIENYMGISSPYEPPDNPDLDLNTGEQLLNECVKIIVHELKDRGVIFGSS